MILIIKKLKIIRFELIIILSIKILLSLHKLHYIMLLIIKKNKDLKS